MSDDRVLRVRLLAEVNSYLDGMRRAGTATTDFGKNVSGHGTAVKRDMEKVGRGALLMSAGIVVALGASVKAAMDWESAWAGVNKTVEGTTDEMADLEDGLRGLAKTLPATHKEIAAVAEAAGALGVQRDAILGFTKVMIDLGETTNLSSDEAATSIAQMMNIMQTAPADVDNLASTLVALGNAGASTESEILEMSLRLAGAGKLIGATEGEVLALSNAMASLGIQAQLGGGAMSRQLQNIYSAVESGGEKLEGFARVANMSADEFAAAFEADPVRAVDSFIKGLNGIEASGGNVIKTLSDLKIKGTQDLSVLLRLKGAGDLLTDGLELQAKAWQENTALAIEANKRYETTASQLKVLKNNVVDLGIDLGGVLLPALKSAAGGAEQLIAGFSSLPDIAKSAVVGFAVLTAGALGLVAGIVKLRTALLTMGAAGRATAAALPWLTAAAVAIAAVSFALGGNAQKARDAEERVRGWTDAIKESGDAAAGTEEHLTDLITQNADLAEMMERTGTTIHDMAAALSGSDSDFDDFKSGLLDSAEAAGYNSAQIEILETVLNRMRGESQTAAENVATLGAVEDKTAEQTGGLTRAQKDLAAAAEEVTAAIEAEIDAQKALFDPIFGMTKALADNKQAQKDLQTTLKDGEASAEDIEAAYIAVAESALGVDAAALQLAGGVKAGTVNVDLAKASLQTLVDAGLIPAGDAATILGGIIDTTTAKADEFAGERVATFVAETEAADHKIQALYDKWSGRTINVTLNPKIGTSAGSSTYKTFPGLLANPESRMGNVFAFRRGGVSQAHIARDGSILKYAEKATGGEAFVPRYGDVARSMGILQTAAGWYGASVTRGGSSPVMAGAPSSPPVVVDLGPILLTVDGKQVTQVVKKQVRIEGGAARVFAK